MSEPILFQMKRNLKVNIIDMKSIRNRMNIWFLRAFQIYRFSPMIKGLFS